MPMYTLGRTYPTRRGKARLVGVDGDWLVWQPSNAVVAEQRFKTKREDAEIRVSRRGAVEVRT